MASRKQNRPYPKHTLKQAMVVAQAIMDSNAGKPMKKLLVADSIKRKPTSPEFRDLLSSSYKYGLTKGTEKADYIELTDLGERFTKPITPEVGLKAKQESALFPPLFKNIFTHYKNNKFPRGEFFKNALEMEFKVPREYIDESSKVLEENGKFAGIIKNISGSEHIMLDSLTPQPNVQDSAVEGEQGEVSDDDQAQDAPLPNNEDSGKSEETPCRVRKVFISHGKNKKILSQIETTLKFGGYKPVIAINQESPAIPVPEKIMNAMHECDAAIINISADETYKDEEGKKQYKINDNVLIEIGAAFVLYKKKVILVTDKRIELPSNLQGLYLCYYEGDSMDWEAGLKLQKALTQFSE